MDDLEAAWAEVHAALDLLPGWQVERPAFNERRNEWSLYAFNVRERMKVGHRVEEFTPVAPTQERVVLEMARVLREIAAGRVPG